MFTVGDRYYEARGGVKAIARILFVFDYLCDEFMSVKCSISFSERLLRNR